MNDHPNLERLVTDWLRAGAPPRAPQHVLATALGRVAATGQALPLGARWSDPWAGMAPRLRLALLLVVLAAVLGTIGAGALLRKANIPVPAASNGWLAYSQHAGVTGDDTRNGAMAMYLVRPGAAPLEVSGSGGDTGTAGVRAVCPAFSHDGTRLAFAESRDPSVVVDDAYVWSTRALVVLTLDAAGGAAGSAIRIPVAGTGVDPCPAWTPDDASLVFITGAPGSLGTASVAEGAVVRPIPGADGLDVSALAVSPDGRTIATVGRSGLWLLPIGGGLPRQLAASASAIDWSPDGTRVVAEIPTGASPSGTVLDASIQVIRLDGARDAIGNGYQPVWAPDGGRIAFEDGSGGGIVITNADGSARRSLALGSLPPLGNGPIDVYSGVVWSPDGSQLAFASSQGLVFLSTTGDPAARLVAAASGYAAIGQTGMSWQQIRPGAPEPSSLP